LCWGKGGKGKRGSTERQSTASAFSIDPETVKALTTIAGGEDISEFFKNNP
jgi:hypothetical protein